MKLFLWKPLIKPEKTKARDNSYLRDDTAEMTRIFKRIERVMRDKKPFLDGDFSLSDMAKLAYCSKHMASKVINRMASANFCNYVNRYRVLYAADLIKKYPQMKKSEVAYMSGFNTLPSFNSAFKNVLSVRPSEYLATCQGYFRQLISKKKAGEQ